MHPVKLKVSNPILLLLEFSILLAGLPTHVQGDTLHDHDASKGTIQETSNSSRLGITEKLGHMVALDAIVRDEEGKTVRFGDLLTVPTILLPVYYSCPSVCNFLQANVAKVLPEVDLDPGKEFQVISLSFDYMESPEIARQAKTDFLSITGEDWPSSAWRFLTGDKKNIESIMDSIGFQFQRKEDSFVHPVVIVAISSEGKIVRYLYGENPLPFDFTMAMTEAAEGQQGLSIKRALTYCFSYDPKSNRYTLNVLRIAGAAVLGLALVLLLALTLGGRKKRKRKE